MKLKIQNSKVKTNVILIITFVLAFGSAAHGAAITKTGGADFDVTGASFSGLEISPDDVLVLETTPEAVWTAGGVKVNASSGKVTDEADIASDGAGGVFVAWSDLADDPTEVHGQVHIARVGSDGAKAWENAVTADTANYYLDPKIIQSFDAGKPTPVDGAVVAWAHMVGNKDYIYARKYNLAGSATSSFPVCADANAQNRPCLVTDQAGGAVIAWRDYRDVTPEVFAQKMNAGGTMQWTNNGITVCATALHLDAPQICSLMEAADEGYMVGWVDDREDDGDDELYVARVKNDGSVDTSHFGTRGVSVSASTANKADLQMANARTYNGAHLIWEEGEQSTADIYTQLVMASGTRFWGASGVALSTASGKQFSPRVTGLPNLSAVASWFHDLGGGNYDCYVQKLSAYGTPEWTAGGKNIDLPLIYDMAYDGSEGVYAAGMGGTLVSPVPYAQRIDASGNEMWGAEGFQLSSGTAVLTDNALQVVASENPGAIVLWHQASGGGRDVYVQKISDLYGASGVYTTEKIENTDVNFDSWDTLTWISSGSGSISAQVRTAASSSGLDAESWAGVANGGSILPDNGKWIQARFTFAPPAGRQSTPDLSTLSLNYTTVATDTAYPVIEYVKVGGITISTTEVYPVSGLPVIDSRLSDDRELSTAEVKVDGSTVGYSITSATATRWDIRSEPTISVGDHTLVVEAVDQASNRTIATYHLTRKSLVGIEGERVGVMASGDRLDIGYTLSVPVKVRIEIRDLKGRLIEARAAEAGDTGGSAGYNELSFDASNLSRGVYIIKVAPQGGKPVVTKFALR